jgi:very-short-patch-repair endonuclease
MRPTHHGTSVPAIPLCIPSGWECSNSPILRCEGVGGTLVHISKLQSDSDLPSLHPFVMNVVERLIERGGIARARDLVDAGTSAALLTRAVREGLILRVSRGVYALPDHDSELLTALSLGTELACISAAQYRGIWVLRKPLLLHIAADHGRPIRGDQLRVHRAACPISDLTMCLQSVRCLPELDALCIVESAVVLKRVALADLRSEVGMRGSASLRKVLALLDPHAESILETADRYHLIRAGYQVASQVYIPGAGRLDLVVDGVLGIEADGRKYHSDPREFEEDRRRWNLLTTRGVPILRVTYRLVVGDPDQFLLLVRAALAAGSSPQR